MKKQLLEEARILYYKLDEMWIIDKENNKLTRAMANAGMRYFRRRDEKLEKKRGRPCKLDKKKAIGLKLSPDVVEWLNSQEIPKAQIIEREIRKLMR
jgi:uncharacterized protein (DUF4415 family)